MEPWPAVFWMESISVWFSKPLANEQQTSFEPTLLFTTRNVDQLLSRDLISISLHRAVMEYLQDLKVSIFGGKKTGTIDLSQPSLWSTCHTKILAIAGL